MYNFFPCRRCRKPFNNRPDRDKHEPKCGVGNGTETGRDAGGGRGETDPGEKRTWSGRHIHLPDPG